MGWDEKLWIRLKLASHVSDGFFRQLVSWFGFFNID